MHKKDLPYFGCLGIFAVLFFGAITVTVSSGILFGNVYSFEVVQSNNPDLPKPDPLAYYLVFASLIPLTLAMFFAWLFDEKGIKDHTVKVKKTKDGRKP